MYISKTTTSSKQSSKPIKSVTTGSDDTIVEPLFTISDHSSCPAYQVELKINNKPVVMEIDTGAGV